MKGVNYDCEQINKYTTVWNYPEASGLSFASFSLEHKLLDPFQTAFCNQTMHKLNPSNLQIEILTLMTGPWSLSVCSNVEVSVSVKPRKKVYPCPVEIE